MIQGKCPKCGQFYFGWALIQPRNQMCTVCNISLLINQEGKTAIESASPFSTSQYQLQLPDELTPGSLGKDESSS